MAFKGQTGTSLGGMEESPERKRRRRKKRERDEKRWAHRNGPVATRQLTPEERQERGLPPC